MHRHFISDDESNGSVVFWQNSKFDPIWGIPGVKMGSYGVKMGSKHANFPINFDKKLKTRTQ